MPRRSAKVNGDSVGFEAKLWQTADALRNNMAAAEYKHVVLGMVAYIVLPDVYSWHEAPADLHR